MEIKKIEGSVKTALKSPWQHGATFTLPLLRGKVANGTSFGYVSFDDSSRTFPAIVLKDDSGKLQHLFVSMLVKQKTNINGDSVSYDTKSLNVLADEIYSSAKTDEVMCTKLCDLMNGHTILCDRSKSYKDLEGKTQRLIQFFIKQNKPLCGLKHSLHL